MNKSEIKCRIDELQHLPTMPQIAAQVLALPLDGSPNSDGIVALIGSDPCLAAQVLRAANAPELGAHTPCTDIAEAVARLGPGLVHSTVVSIALSTVSSAATGVATDHRSFWMHCIACGVCADLLAERIGSSYRSSAFVAGLLHDIGKIVLELVVPEAYARALDVATRHDIFILEAERRELGIDHALIGKWLAESWELPHLFTDVIWLHHHEPGTLDATQYPVELIELVSLANTLSHECLQADAPMGRREFISDEQLQRLGLRRADLDELRVKAPHAIRERLNKLQPVLDEDLSAEALQKATRELLMAGARFDMQAKGYRREAQRLRALNEMHAKLRPRQSLREVLEIAVDAVRRGLEIEAGACLVADAKERLVLGKRWRTPQDRAREFMYTLEGEAPPALANADPTFVKALDDLAFRRNAQGWAGAAVTAPVRRESLMVTPMRADGRTVGHIVVEIAPGDSRVPQEQMSELEEFAEACGRAVARQRAEEDLLERAEDLAASLWKKEVAHKKGLQAERINSEANVAAGAAHALSKYLAEITIQAQLLLHRRRDGDDAGALGAIVRGSRRAHKVLDDLITFARTPLPKLEPTLIHFVLHQAVSQFRDRLDEKNIHVVESYEEGLPRVLVDRHQIVQAVGELFKNAEDAMGDRGGTLSITTAATPDRRQLTITVGDTGPGISPSIRDRVFEPFFTTREDRDRLGLGLPLCHRIVEKHRGNIHIDSAPGQGTRVVLSFPSTVHLTAQRTAPVAPPPPGPEQVEGAPTILVVDDEEQLCNALREHLRNRGYRVETAGDGIEGLRIIATNAIDLVLLDICMPTRDGLSVLEELHERFSSVPVIVMTGMATSEDVENALRLGARSCLSKPFEVGHMLAEIEMVLARKR